VPDAVFFDVDGVLLDTVRAKGDAFADAFECSPGGRGLVMGLHMSNGGVPREPKVMMIFEALHGRSATSDEVSALVDRFAELAIERVLAASEIPGASSALAELSRHVPLHAVSATPFRELVRIFEARGWAGYFRSIHGIPPTKTLTVSNLLGEHGYEAAKCFMIGDSSQDRDAARANAVPFIFVCNDAEDGDPSDLEIVSDLLPLPSIVLSARKTGR
jgi:phosphoglycolate phosphatase-like HAD superfamily hydrolase